MPEFSLVLVTRAVLASANIWPYELSCGS